MCRDRIYFIAHVERKNKNDMNDVRLKQKYCFNEMQAQFFWHQHYNPRQHSCVALFCGKLIINCCWFRLFNSPVGASTTREYSVRCQAIKIQESSHREFRFFSYHHPFSYRHRCFYSHLCFYRNLHFYRHPCLYRHPCAGRDLITQLPAQCLLKPLHIYIGHNWLIRH